jgi:hypothetical protein
METDKKNSYILKILLMAAIFLVGTGLDQVSKAWARAEELTLGQRSEPVLGTMVIVLAYNEGAFLGLGDDWPSPSGRSSSGSCQPSVCWPSGSTFSATTKWPSTKT